MSGFPSDFGILGKGHVWVFGKGRWPIDLSGRVRALAGRPVVAVVAVVAVEVVKILSSWKMRGPGMFFSDSKNARFLPEDLAFLESHKKRSSLL